MPKLICYGCRKQINDTFEFQQLLVKNNQQLLVMFENEEKYTFLYDNKQSFDNSISNNYNQSFVIEHFDETKEYKINNMRPGEPSNTAMNTKVIKGQMSANDINIEVLDIKEKVTITISAQQAFDTDVSKNRNKTPDNLEMVDLNVNRDATVLINCDQYNKNTTNSNVESLIKTEIIEVKDTVIINGKVLGTYTTKIDIDDKPIEFKCDLCNKMYKKRKLMKRHIHFAHGDRNERPYQCLHCKRTFRFKQFLHSHISQVHNAVKTTCTICNKAVTDIKRHTLLHNDKKYQCPRCDKKFVMNSRLSDHLRRVHSIKPYLCSVCGKGCVSPTDLTIHMRVHTGEKPFECEHCQKTFRNRSQYLCHSRIHTGEKPYPCTHCDKKFRLITCLKNHIRTHTGERPFECHICQKNFGHRSTLKTHMKIHA